MFAPEVDAAQQPGKLLRGDFAAFFFRLRPGKSVRFQSLHPETEAIAIPVDQFDLSPTPAGKDEQGAGERILGHQISGDAGQAVDRFAHVRAARPDEHAQIFNAREH